MGKYDKILIRMQNNPKNVSFDELKVVLEHLGLS